MTDGDRQQITPAQAEARRANAKAHSTGPRTAAGKRRSSRNAIRHGLYGKTDPVVDAGVFGEDPEQYRDLLRDLVAEFDPVGTVEEELVSQLASVLWRLRRVQGFEALALSGASYIDLEADQRRAEVNHLLLIAAYFHGEAPADEVDAGGAAAAAWLGADCDGGDEATPPDVERLAIERWGSLDAAGDAALDEAGRLAGEFAGAQREWLGPAVHGVIAEDTLNRLARPEAHLGRQRDQILRLIGELREARLKEAEER